MEVILQQDIENLGKKGTVVDVAKGYARNYLLPEKLAIEATSGNKKAWEHKQKAEMLKDAREQEEAEQLAELIEKLNIVMPGKVSQEGHLYGSVTSTDIANEIEKKLKLTIDRRKIRLEESIKQIGDYEIPIRLHRKVTAKAKVRVIDEEEMKGKRE